MAAPLAAPQQHLLDEIHAYVSNLDEANPYIREKYRMLADRNSAPALINLFRHELELAGIDPTGKVVLDAGCGSGRFTLLFLLAGAKRVDSIDLFPANVRALQAIAQRFSLPINARHVDICATGIPEASVDIAYCNEAISHFNDWRAFIRETGRVLAPNGRIHIADWNNGANPWLREEIFSFWEESECGPFRASDYAAGQKNLPYLFRRWMILRKSFPSLSDEDIFHIGLRTVGVGGDALLDASKEFVETGRLPESSFRRGMSQSRPEDGQRNEEPIDPREIVRELGAVGVRARARGHFGFNRSPILPYLNRIAGSMGPLPLFVTKKYLVVGQKIAWG